MLRASGVNWDLRKARPYMGYEQYDFNVPVATEGDTYARYIVRIQEIARIAEDHRAGLNKLPLGPVRIDNRKFVPPPRSELGVSMEALIHHFKLWTEGFPAPDASVYSARSNHRAANWVFCSKGMADPSRTASTGAHLPSIICPCCPRSSRDIWWLTWLPSLLLLILCSEILTDEP